MYVCMYVHTYISIMYICIDMPDLVPDLVHVLDLVCMRSGIRSGIKPGIRSGMRSQRLRLMGCMRIT